MLDKLKVFNISMKKVKGPPQSVPLPGLRSLNTASHAHTCLGGKSSEDIIELLMTLQSLLGLEEIFKSPTYWISGLLYSEILEGQLEYQNI